MAAGKCSTVKILPGKDLDVAIFGLGMQASLESRGARKSGGMCLLFLKHWRVFVAIEKGLDSFYVLRVQNTQFHFLIIFLKCILIQPSHSLSVEFTSDSFLKRSWFLTVEPDI